MSSNFLPLLPTSFFFSLTASFLFPKLIILFHQHHQLKKLMTFTPISNLGMEVDALCCKALWLQKILQEPGKTYRDSRRPEMHGAVKKAVLCTCLALHQLGLLQLSVFCCSFEEIQLEFTPAYLCSSHGYSAAAVCLCAFLPLLLLLRVLVASIVNVASFWILGILMMCRW